LHDPETKEQSKVRRQSGSQCPKDFEPKHSSSKVLACVFWDEDGTLLVDHLEKGATTTAQNHIALLDKLKQHEASLNYRIQARHMQTNEL
jgi:hypothetical protein